MVSVAVLVELLLPLHINDYSWPDKMLGVTIPVCFNHALISYLKHLHFSHRHIAVNKTVLVLAVHLHKS